MRTRTQPHGSYATYIIGFVASIICTIGAYLAVQSGSLSLPVVIAIVISLAIIQLIVQLVFFLHLGQEARPRWNLMLFWFMVLVLVIVVGGSLWIMQNLDYHHGSKASPSETNRYIEDKERIYKTN